MRRKFNSLFPKSYFVEPEDLSGLEAYLLRQKILSDEESIEEASPVGEGNMNLTLRLRIATMSKTRNLILKQARPWVEKYPQIEAPVERAASEALFYEMTSQSPTLSTQEPKLLHFDKMSSVLFFEDLGDSSDFMGLYRGETKLSDDDIKDLAGYLAVLHSGFRRDSAATLPELKNKKMRQLNHEHIFVIPLNRPLEDLEVMTSGLGKLGAVFRADEALSLAVKNLGKTYLEDGPVLLHGDFYPGSWIKTQRQQIQVIDSEFAFFGRPEFDVGIFIAHLMIAQIDISKVDLFLQRYLDAPGLDLEQKLTFQFAGVEIFRRIFGVAQLPIENSLSFKERLLVLSRGWLVG